MSAGNKYMLWFCFVAIATKATWSEFALWTAAAVIGVVGEELTSERKRRNDAQH